MYRIAYLECELKSRDFDSRMQIAAHLLKAGVTVVIGQCWGIWNNIETAPKGCFLFATVNKIKAEHIQRAKASGHIVVAADEESLPFDGCEFLANVAPEALANVDLFLTQRAAQTDIVRERFPTLPIETAGSVRVDLLKIAKNSRPIREPYILFNTGLAILNSIWGDANFIIKRLADEGAIDLESEKGRAAVQLRLDAEAYAKEHILALIRWSADNLPVRTVIRPHPAEKASSWRELNHPKILVVEQSSPGPWIANAKAVVHSNSTTGLEAALLGTPCLNISHDKHEAWAARFLMRKVNPTASNAQEASERIADFFKMGKGLNSKLVAFPPAAAAKTAQSIMTLLDQRGAGMLPPRYGWGRRSARKPVDELKFSVTPTEFTERLEAVAKGIKLPVTECTSLDDSVVMISPISR